MISQANDRITVRTVERTDGALGAESPTVTATADLWAVVREASAEVVDRFSKSDVSVTHTVFVRGDVTMYLQGSGDPVLSYEETEVVWEGRTLRPVAPPSRVGVRSEWTETHCEDITDYGD